MEWLEELTLNQFDLSYADLNQLRYLPLLTKLTLSTTTPNLDMDCLTDRQMRPLSYLVKLTHLNLGSKWPYIGRNEIGAEGVMELGRLFQLTSLDLVSHFSFSHSINFLTEAQKCSETGA